MNRYTLSPPRRRYPPRLDDDDGGAPWILPGGGPPQTWSLDVAVAERELLRAIDPTEVWLRRSSDTGALTLECKIVPFNEFALINERGGSFYERFLPRSIRTWREGRKPPMLFEHGEDARIGRAPIAAVDALRDEADGCYVRATLLDGVPPLIVSGIRKGLFGMSVRFRPLRVDVNRRPRRSEANPDQIPEHSVVEASVKEVSLCSFPAYASTHAKFVERKEQASAWLLP